LLLRAVLLPADCSSGLTGLPSAANEAVGASVLTLLDPAAYGLLCSHGTGAEEDAGPSSGQPGKHGQHLSPACCGMCCVPALPAVLAGLPAPQAQSQIFAGAFAESVRLAANSLTRNRSPPAFLSA
jgi:hypothetical protein